MANMDPPLVRLSTTRGGSSGYFALVSKEANTASRTTPATRNPIVKGLLHAVVSACEKPKTSENSPPATRKRPGRSNGSWSAPSSSCQPERGADDGDRSKHEVDEERPSPRGVGGEDAAEEESERAACAGDGAVDPEGLPTLLRISEGGGQEGQHRGGEQGPERALDGPGDDEHGEVDRGTHRWPRPRRSRPVR